MKNSFKQIDEPQLPIELENRIKSNVESRLGFMKFIGNVMDLYIGKAGNTISKLFLPSVTPNHTLINEQKIDFDSGASRVIDEDAPPSEGKA